MGAVLARGWVGVDGEGGGNGAAGVVGGWDVYRWACSWGGMNGGGGVLVRREVVVWIRKGRGGGGGGWVVEHRSYIIVICFRNGV